MSTKHILGYIVHIPYIIHIAYRESINPPYLEALLERIAEYLLSFKM